MNISSENMALQLAGLRGEIFSTLFDATNGGESGTASFADILGGKTAALAGDGRNPALRDPESAFRMMSHINGLEVSYKAQYAELAALGTSVEHLEDVGGRLSDIDHTTANGDIVARLQDFVAQYNAWEDRFDDTVATGGVLDNVQAAEISLWELEQSIKSIFHGAAADVGGLADLGIAIDPATRQAVLDVGRLESMLASNKRGVVSAIDEFSAHFAKSADLLNAEDNFIPRALDNRDRAIQFIADNGASLREEFGTGDAARPTGDVARALAAYRAMFDGV